MSRIPHMCDFVVLGYQPCWIFCLLLTNLQLKTLPWMPYLPFVLKYRQWLSLLNVFACRIASWKTFLTIRILYFTQMVIFYKFSSFRDFLYINELSGALLEFAQPVATSRYISDNPCFCRTGLFFSNGMPFSNVSSLAVVIFCTFWKQSPQSAAL